ncbi:MAG: hypothetical protein ACKERG_00490 [Candidatus Hodgkinia cicadicola]
MGGGDTEAGWISVNERRRTAAAGLRVVCMSSRSVNVVRSTNCFKSYYEMLVHCSAAASA